MKHVASLCNSTEAFQGANRKSLLTVSMLQKKLADWLSFVGLPGALSGEGCDLHRCPLSEEHSDDPHGRQHEDHC